MLFRELTEIAFSYCNLYESSLYALLCMVEVLLLTSPVLPVVWQWRFWDEHCPLQGTGRHTLQDFEFLWHSTLPFFMFSCFRKKESKKPKAFLWFKAIIGFSMQFKFWVGDHWNVRPGRRAWSAAALPHTHHCIGLHVEMALNWIGFSLFRSCEVNASCAY